MFRGAESTEKGGGETMGTSSSRFVGLEKGREGAGRWRRGHGRPCAAQLPVYRGLKLLVDM